MNYTHNEIITTDLKWINIYQEWRSKYLKNENIYVHFFNPKINMKKKNNKDKAKER